jgi:hypothetical protein
MRRVSMATRDELVVAVRGRYANSGRGEKTRILDEFVAVTGFHRKHAMRVLRGEQGAADCAAQTETKAGPPATGPASEGH